MDNDYPDGTSDTDKARITKHTYYTNLLHLSDDGLTFMNHVKTIYALWEAFEASYSESDIPYMNAFRNYLVLGLPLLKLLMKT